MTDDEKERVRQATDIVALVGETVELRRRGRDWWGCCPFHHEKSPSFHVIPATGVWKCFGCGKGGDVFSYVMEREHLEFPDAARYLADRAGIELSEPRRGSWGSGPRQDRNRLVACLGEAADFYHKVVRRERSDEAQAARSYLAGRKFNSDVCARWMIGYAPGHGRLVQYLRGRGYTDAELEACDLAYRRGNRSADVFFDRVMFPIEDEHGSIIGFGGRVLTSGSKVAKYRNSKDSRLFHKKKHLFAFKRAKDAIRATGTVYVVEGYCDAITMHEHGFTNVVATLGTALTTDHVRSLSRFAKRIVCLFDGDAAGQRAAERAVQYVTQTEAQLMAVVLPDDLDPDEFINQRGADALRAELEGKAKPLLDFVFDKRLAEADLSTPGLRLSALDSMAQLLAPLKGSALLDAYVGRLADVLRLERGAVLDKVRQAKVPSYDDEGWREQRGPAQGSEEPPPYSDSDIPYDEYGSYDYQGTYAAPARPRLQDDPYRAISAEDRNQVGLECELLDLLSRNPQLFRGQEERIGSLSWSDARHEAIAWAILAMPEDATPAEALATAEAVCPDAANILASARFLSGSNAPDEACAAFLLDSVELASTRSRVREIKLQLAQSPPDASDLMREGARLRKRERELLAALEKDRSQLANALPEE